MFLIADHVDGVRHLRTTAINGLIAHPPDECDVESHDDDDAGWGKLQICPPELSGNPTSRDIWHQVGRMNEEVRILHISIFDMSTELLTCRKILRHEASGFTSHSKEGVVQNFIALKNPSPRLGLNPRALGPVASTLITIPPRRPAMFLLSPTEN
jgi:hypothetical protein